VITIPVVDVAEESVFKDGQTTSCSGDKNLSPELASHVDSSQRRAAN
jgi:hypothetical protein